MREGAARRQTEQRGIRQDHEPGNTQIQSGHIGTSHTPHHSVISFTSLMTSRLPTFAHGCYSETKKVQMTDGSYECFDLCHAPAISL